MTKAKARERAKTKAAKKTKKPAPNAGEHGQKIVPGRFDPGSGSIKSPRTNVNTKNIGAMKRGSPRSG
jgi:hypothetical protein